MQISTTKIITKQIQNQMAKKDFYYVSDKYNTNTYPKTVSKYIRDSDNTIVIAGSIVTTKIK